jgi:hypothetical protein
MDSVISELMRIDGARVTMRLEIEARAPDGLATDDASVVRDSAKTLKFALTPQQHLSVAGLDDVDPHWSVRRIVDGQPPRRPVRVRRRLTSGLRRAVDVNCAANPQQLLIQCRFVRVTLRAATVTPGQNQRKLTCFC